MIRSFTLCAALFGALSGASPALALSCMQPDVANSYTWAAEAEAPYVVLLGEFQFRAGTKSRGNSDGQTVPPVVAQFSGRSLGDGGFTRPFSGAVTLAPACAGPWCAGLPEPGIGLAFAEVMADGTYQVALGPCGGRYFPGPRAGEAARVEACHRGERCDAAPRLR